MFGWLYTYLTSDNAYEIFGTAIYIIHNTQINVAITVILILVFLVLLTMRTAFRHEC
jgi:hypothetical protein